MELQQFNKWTQYLKRNVHLEACKRIPDTLNGVDAGTWKDNIWHTIAHNRNFDITTYSREFPNIDWNRYLSPPTPLSPAEFNDLMTITFPDYDGDVEPNVADLMSRVSAQQIEDIFRLTKFSPIRVFEDVGALPFVQRRDIPIDVAARVIPYLDVRPGGDGLSPEYDMWVACELASRPDLTPIVARQLYNHIIEKHNKSNISQNQSRVLQAIAANPSMSLDELYDIFGPIPEIALNQSFGYEQMRDPRYKRAVMNCRAWTYACGNCNFTTNTTVRGSWYCYDVMNPKYNPCEFNDWRMLERHLLVRNEYTKNPYWNAKCRRRAVRRDHWLAFVWRTLCKRLPPEMVEHVLSIWYSPVKF